MALEGSERKVLHAIVREQGNAQAGYVEDSKIAEIAYLRIEEVRDYLETVEGKGYVERSIGVSGHSAYITAKGRQELRRSKNGGDGGEPTPRRIKVVPKGLRSFDEHDADFFLELLPGPRHADGLPESIHFWKTRIEETAPDRTFAVGVIYGPSGCGKSSLVKAGLLPRLSESVLPVYLEATADDTEVRLLKGLGRYFPDLHADVGLRDTLSALRAGTGSSATNKVLIVLDQFEQWLHAKRSEEGTELALALGQCDGERLQALLMVRDDFWMALTRFMGEMEIALKQWENFAAVDLFDLRHASKVLTAFGQAFGTLPDRLEDLTRGEQGFLDQAVNGLARDGRIISVRLALFAEMAKGKPWTPATLREVGGMEGIGVTFLEETFGSIALKAHQKSAEHVLKALLPESGTSIKGHMQSHEELMKASGYAARPKAFGDLLHILDSETRLITPIDPEGIDTEGEERHDPEGKFYQLTHDYLVPSLREWLTRKQRETRRGRAELLLAERAAFWKSKPDDRHLPSWWECLRIHLLTKQAGWTDSEKMMMRKAGRYHFARTLPLAVVVFLAFSGMAAIAWLKWQDEVVAREEKRTERYFYNVAQADSEWRANHIKRARDLLENETECPKDLRGWEWDYLKRLFYPNPPSLEQGRPLAAVAFTDKSKVISVSKGAEGQPGTVFIWDTDANKSWQKFPLPPGIVSCARFSADGRRLALAFEQPRHISNLNISSVGKTPAIDEFNVMVMNVDTGKVSYADDTGKVSYPDSVPNVSALALSPDGRLLAIARNSHAKNGDPRTATLTIIDLEHPPPCQDL